MVAAATDARIIAGYRGGESMESLAKRFRCSLWLVHDRLHRDGISIRSRRRDVPEKEIRNAYLTGSSAAELQRRYRCSQDVIYRILREAGIIVDSRRRNSLPVDHDYFSRIDTSEKAYWLGFIFADGNVCEYSKGHKCFCLALKEQDRQHLEAFRQAVKSEHKLVATKNGAYMLRFASLRLCNSLIRYGCIPRKSGVHGTPQLADRLYPHFYRGYFDGDGYIGICKNRQPAFTVLGPLKFLVQFQDFLVRKAKASLTKIRKTGNIHRLDYGGKRQLRRIGKCLFCGGLSAPELVRKAAIWTSF